MLWNRQAPDGTLIRAVLQGQTQRFAGLVDRYQNLVYSTIRARVSHPDEAEDLVQETFLRAYRHLGALEDLNRFGPWLRRIAVNVAINYQRAAGARRRAYETVLSFPLTPETPDQQLESEEIQARIWTAIDGLPVELREVVLLYYLGSAQDTCKILSHRNR